ncbi:hypothetical protein V2I01_34795 [Micromonospora sp. BRA006-A]|nr:hypothetical protein [Micromonospora sp. BRA006-A]
MTSTASPCGIGWEVPTTEKGIFPAAAKTGGASPTWPMSIEPALSASVSAGPLSNSDQVTFFASPRALTRLSPPKRW